jgi:hypothetical protein
MKILATIILTLGLGSWAAQATSLADLYSQFPAGKYENLKGNCVMNVDYTESGKLIVKLDIVGKGQKEFFAKQASWPLSFEAKPLRRSKKAWEKTKDSLQIQKGKEAGSFVTSFKDCGSFTHDMDADGPGAQAVEDSESSQGDDGEWMNPDGPGAKAKKH